MVKELKNIIEKLFKDPIMAILLKNSNLTSLQFESLLIDYYIDNMTDIVVTSNDKAAFRSKKVSRGSFRRTLSQGRKNIISSIYTILLLSYIGIYDPYPFDEYKILAEKLSEYSLIAHDENNENSRLRIRKLELELLKGIRSLAEPKHLK